ncbi:MAG: hypothetical protein OXE50_10530 [Chloroflexi bacterium]|nr:hypothetical protein [Chloroflexota bacterium]
MNTLNFTSLPLDSVPTYSNLYVILARLIDQLDRGPLHDSGVIRWSCPVIAFGDVINPKVATLGLNPSNREFMDKAGLELKGWERRFPTLTSLGLTEWAEVDTRDLEMIMNACQSYFHGNPYNAWFKKLDDVVAGAGASFYSPFHSACHLDLVPYATAAKWITLNEKQRDTLLQHTTDTLGQILQDVPATTLILNGQSVVRQFESLFGCSLTREEAPAWTLHRESHRDVPGVAYRGVVTSLGGTRLDRELTVLGFNHNLQSSFGISSSVIEAIKNWIQSIMEDSNW